MIPVTIPMISRSIERAIEQVGHVAWDAGGEMKPEYDFLPLAEWQRREPRLCRGCGLTLLRLMEK
jgi:hypothetical protein